MSTKPMRSPYAKSPLPVLPMLAALLALGSPQAAFAKAGTVEAVQKSTESQIRHLIEPLLDKYCQDSCKLLSVTSTVELAVPEQLAPGFDEIGRGPASKQEDLAPTSARLKLLIDDKVGPVSRQKLLELVQQFLDTLEYPVKVDTQVAHFPQPLGTDSKIAELREKLIKQFRGQMDELFAQFCPDSCLMADFNVQTEAINPEEAQYGKPGEFLQDNGVALRIKDISATVLMDDALSPEERSNVLEMAKLKTSAFRNVTLAAKAMKFPHPDVSRIASRSGSGRQASRGLASVGDSRDSKESRDSKSNSDSQTTETQNVTAKQVQNNSSQNTENNQRQEKFERFEKIERVENGDAVQAELKSFKLYALVFGCAILSLLLLVAVAGFRSRRPGDEPGIIQRALSQITSDPAGGSSPAAALAGASPGETGEDRRRLVAMRYEIDRIAEELTNVFAQQPKVAKQVFSRVLTEEGIETCSRYIQIFGESIVMDMLRDPSLQGDLAELMEFHAKNPEDLKDEAKLELLRKLHNRTVAGKLFVMGNRSTNLFDFLADMDGLQILELVRNESFTVKSIVLTQVDPQKRAAIYSQLDEETRMKLLSELSRIDYLPRDYIFNVANALRRKRKDNPRLNTEALPGSEVLVNLLERTGIAIQRSVIGSLELTNPESARTVKAKLVSPDTLRYLRDGQLLEVVLSLRHDELLQFLKGAPAEIKAAIFAKSPKELVVELEDELSTLGVVSREAYLGVERKVINRMKVMAHDGLINLIETNERMFASGASADPMSGIVNAAVAGGGPLSPDGQTSTTTANIRKVAGW